MATIFLLLTTPLHLITVIHAHASHLSSHLPLTRSSDCRTLSAGAILASVSLAIQERF